MKVINQGVFIKIFLSGYDKIFEQKWMRVDRIESVKYRNSDIESLTAKWMFVISAVTVGISYDIYVKKNFDFFLKKTLDKSTGKLFLGTVVQVFVTLIRARVSTMFFYENIEDFANLLSLVLLLDGFSLLLQKKELLISIYE